MQCISYGVGSGLISNAVWKGVPLPTLLAMVKPRADTRGRPLPRRRRLLRDVPALQGQRDDDARGLGDERRAAAAASRFPMRMIVPGIYGERNPKWVTRLEFLAKDDPRLKINRHGIEGVGFYTEQGWGPNIFVPTTSRIDAPQVTAATSPSPSRWAKRWSSAAWPTAATRASARWRSAPTAARLHAADIHQPGTLISWSLWRYEWTPTAPADEVRVFVRAVNAKGERQIEQFRDQVPHGATGLHWVRGRVEAEGSSPKVAVAGPGSFNPRSALCHRGIWNA